MTKPNAWDQEAVDIALAGDTDAICDAFVWNSTPQGFGYWMRAARAPELSPEAREILVNWSNEK